MLVTTQFKYCTTSCGSCKPRSGSRTSQTQQQQDQKVAYPKLEKDASEVLVVVGAGISGLSIADNLAKAVTGVIVIESRVVGEDLTLAFKEIPVELFFLLAGGMIW